MRTDLEVIVDGINELLAKSPMTISNGIGLGTWENDRKAALHSLLGKLDAAPFYAITTTQEQPIFGAEKENYKCPDCKCEYPRCDCDLDDETDGDMGANLGYVKELLEVRMKLQEALGNGSNEKLWPSGTNYIDAACKVITECQGDAEAIAYLSKTLEKTRTERDKYKATLEKLSKLGGGNSDGNWIALQALKGE